jgi:23S rRNA (pseudouridine1915-N3)-methyltransferase
MKIRIVAVGRVKEKPIQYMIDEYMKRMNDIEIIEVKDSGKEKEAENILRLCENHGMIVLDEKGKEYTSEEFSERIARLTEKTSFVVGGPDGISDKVKEKAKEIISLSKMTFTHEMTRLFLIEQLYRAKQIRKGTSYHR